MTQAQLDRAVAEATGESVRMVHRLGFGLLETRRDRPEDEEIDLRVDCPCCGHAVAYPGAAGDGRPALAECLACDVYFDFAPGDVYAAGSA